jgi:hypothetical protein
MRESCGWVFEGFVTPTRVTVPRAKILSARTIHHKPLTMHEWRARGIGESRARGIGAGCCVRAGAKLVGSALFFVRSTSWGVDDIFGYSNNKYLAVSRIAAVHLGWVGMSNCSKGPTQSEQRQATAKLLEPFV